jgi:exosortase
MQEIGTSHTGHRWQDVPIHQWIKAAIIAVLFIFLFRYELMQLLRRWATDASWSHGFLVPLFSLYFVHQRRGHILTRRYHPQVAGLLLLLCTILFYVFNIVSPSGYAYFRGLSLIFACVSILLLLGGWALLRETWLPVSYLIFAVPLPQRLYVSLTFPMRKLAAVVAAALLNLVPDVHTSVAGVIIDIEYKGQALEPALNVAEACSGMRFLMAFVALGVAMAYLHPRALWQRVILLVNTVPIAIFCNIVRVTVTGFLYVLVHPRYTQGIYHNLLGIAMLPLAFGAYGFLSWFTASLFMDNTVQGYRDVVIRKNTQESKP